MVPSLDDDGWQLESAVARHTEAPATFEIPDEVPLSLGDRIEFEPHDIIDALPPERWSKGPRLGGSSAFVILKPTALRETQQRRAFAP